MLNQPSPRARLSAAVIELLREPAAARSALSRARRNVEIVSAPCQRDGDTHQICNLLEQTDRGIAQGLTRVWLAHRPSEFSVETI